MVRQFFLSHGCIGRKKLWASEIIFFQYDHFQAINGFKPLIASHTRISDSLHREKEPRPFIRRKPQAGKMQIKKEAVS
jgi:hypothetical protein